MRGPQHRQAPSADPRVSSPPSSTSSVSSPVRRGYSRDGLSPSTKPVSPPRSAASRWASWSQVTPWNYPLMMAIWRSRRPIAAGNTVVLKPADTTPWSTVRLAELAQDVRRPAYSTSLRRPGHRSGAGRAPATGHGRDHRQHPRRLGGHEVGGGHPEERPPRARGQGTRPGLRGRRPGGDRGRDRDRRLLQRRPGLHGSDPGAGAGKRSTTSSPASCADSAKRLRVGAPDDGADYGAVNPAGQQQRVEEFLSRLPAHAEVAGGRDQPRAGVLRGRDRRGRGAAGRRRGPAGDLRPGPHRAALRRRGRGAGRWPTTSTSPWPPASGRATTAACSGLLPTSSSGSCG